MATYVGTEATGGVDVAKYVPPVGIDLQPSFPQSDFAFVVLAFDPLRGSFIEADATTLKLNVQQVNGTLVPTEVEIKLNKVLVYGTSADPGQPGVVAFAPDFSGSSITDVGGGVWEFLLVKGTNWITGTRNEVLLFLPFE